MTQAVCSLTEVLNAGWNLSQKSFTECLKKTEHESFKELIDVLLNSDIREYGVPWLGDYKKSTQLEANGRIVQLTRLRNISIPQAVEDMMMTTSADNRGPCVLRLTFTDGRNTITGLDMQDKTDLSMDIPPGTKFRLMGSIPISMGFLLLSKNHLKVLGGTVTNLIREWNMTKFLKDTENRNITGGAPVFVPFGSREATDLIQSEGKFLSQLRSDRESNQMKFDSFQMATARNEPQEESELQAMFNEQRKEILAELKASNSSSSTAAGGGGRGGDKTVSNYHNANRTFPGSTTRRFKPGLSKFYQLQLQKSEEYSLAIAQLLSLGYPYQLASSALKINRGNYQAAVDYLLSKSTSTSMHLDENPGNNHHHQTPMIPSSSPLTRGSRPYGGRGSRGGRGRFNSTEGDEMNSSRFHSSSADTPQSRPSTGLVRLDDLIVDSMPTKSSATAAAPPSSTATTKGVHQTVVNHHRLKPTANQVLLSVGCPILAQNISGDYEEAQLIGYLSNTNTGSSSGEKIVLVAYLHSDNATGKISIEEEIVPISLIRTMNREKITIDMVPPAPSDRVKPYGSSSNSASMNSNQFDDIHFSHQPYPPTSGRGYRGNSRGVVVAEYLAVEELCRLCQPVDLNITKCEELLDIITDNALRALKTVDDKSLKGMKMLNTFIEKKSAFMKPGRYLCLDFKGKYYRLVLTTVSEDVQEIKKEEEYYSISNRLRCSNAETVFNYIAETIHDFYILKNINEENIPLGICFMFPMKQTSIRDGYVIKWAKEFSINSLIGLNFPVKLQEALKRRGLKVPVTAIANDTVCAFFACAWKDNDCALGLKHSHGSNICCLEKVSDVPKLKRPVNLGTSILLNAEWGQIGEDGCIDDYLTEYDKLIDKFSSEPGCCIFEKLSSGIYIGELCRVIMLKAVEERLLFGGVVPELLTTPYILTYEHVFLIDRDPANVFFGAEMVLRQRFKMTEIKRKDLVGVRYISFVVINRAAHLIGTACAALINQLKRKRITIAVDGTFFRLSKTFTDVLKRTISKLIPQKYSFKLHLVDDASAEGITAIISSLRGDLAHRLSYAGEADLESESEERRELEAILIQEGLDL
ncbi:unnamed protein product [Trichobilharzia szidati]|nr:unnamed protein product [Trichobilharzia szidati]